MCVSCVCRLGFGGGDSRAGVAGVRMPAGADGGGSVPKVSFLFVFVCVVECCLLWLWLLISTRGFAYVSGCACGWWGYW